jgi:hypothetical protein
MKITKPIFIFFLTLIISACNVQAEDETNILRDQISALTKNLDCDNSEQCKSIGYGDKPCGGYMSYLLYSTKTTPETELITKVEQFNKLDKQRNIDNNMVSTCEMLLQSTYTCQQSKCQISNQHFPNSAY